MTRTTHIAERNLISLSTRSLWMEIQLRYKATCRCRVGIVVMQFALRVGHCGFSVCTVYAVGGLRYTWACIVTRAGSHGCLRWEHSSSSPYIICLHHYRHSRVLIVFDRKRKNMSLAQCTMLSIRLLSVHYILIFKQLNLRSSLLGTGVLVVLRYQTTSKFSTTLSIN